MKKFLTAVAVASLISTPALARDRGHDRGGHHERHRGNGGKWVAPLIGGVILGAIIAGSDKDGDSDYYDRRVYRERPVDDYYYDRSYYRRTCWIEERVDYYGYIRQYRVCR